MIRSHYQGCDIEIFSFEPYPKYGVDDITNWIIDVDLCAEGLGSDGFDGYFMDPNPYYGGAPFLWTQVSEIEQFCDQNDVDFGYVFWAPRASYHENTATDFDWYLETMDQGMQCQNAGVTPDYYLYMSWLTVPKQIVPETEEYSFSFSALQFINAFM
ncbi:MAG: hypothetical protein QUS11_00975 [Candidatus Fermentibacter sp.]|nr:hypothetical protein [Candidatus Fermentibacter sp.]